MKAWIADLNTTSFRIFISVCLEVLYVLVVLVGIILGKTMPTEPLYILGGFLIACLGLGNWQFRDKRTTDMGYVAAKNANNQPTVNVGGPVADVNVQGATTTVDAAVAPPAAAERVTLVSPPAHAVNARSFVPPRTPPSVKPLTHRESEAD